MNPTFSLLQTLPDLQAEAGSSFYDAVLQPGDFAYDFPDDGGRRGDKYMQMLDPLVAMYPLMVSPGNHEYHYNFSHYRCDMLSI